MAKHADLFNRIPFHQSIGVDRLLLVVAFGFHHKLTTEMKIGKLK